MSGIIRNALFLVNTEPAQYSIQAQEAKVGVKQDFAGAGHCFGGDADDMEVGDDFEDQSHGCAFLSPVRGAGEVDGRGWPIGMRQR